MNKPERLAPGHRMCAGCGGTIAVRNVLKALHPGDKAVIGNATGCLEVSTFMYPYTAYEDSYIHNAFENAGATLSGVETTYRFMKKKGKLKEDYKFVLVQHYGLFGGNPITYAELGKILKISMHAVQTMEDLALRELRLVSFKFLEELDDYYCDLLILVYDKKISKKEYNALRRAGISTYEELKNCAPERLISFSGIGPRMLKNLKEVQKTL